MFETSRPNGAAIAAFRARGRSGPWPIRWRPTSTASCPITPTSRLRGARLDDPQLRHHRQRDPLPQRRRHLAALDPRSLQHMGDQTLALTPASWRRGVPQAERRRASSWTCSGAELVTLAAWRRPRSLLAALLVRFAWLAWRAARPRPAAAGAWSRRWLLGAPPWPGSAQMVVGCVRAGDVLARLPAGDPSRGLRVGARRRRWSRCGRSARRSTTERLRTGFWLLFLLLGAAVALIAPGGDHLLPAAAAGRAGRRCCARRVCRGAERWAALAAVALLFLTWGDARAARGAAQPGADVAVRAARRADHAAGADRGEAADRRGRAALRDRRVGASLALAGWAAAAAAPAYSADRQQRVRDRACDRRRRPARRAGRWSTTMRRCPPASTRLGQWRSEAALQRAQALAGRAPGAGRSRHRAVDRSPSAVAKGRPRG